MAVPQRGVQVPVEPRDHVERDLLGAGGGALADVGAAAEPLRVVLADHVDDAAVREHISWAQELARQIAEHPSFELAAPHPFSLVCFRYKGSDEQNRELMDRVNASGIAFLSHTVLNGRFVIRLAIGNVRVTREDIQRVWDCIQAQACVIRSGAGCYPVRDE